MIDANTVYRAALERAHVHALAYIAGLDGGPVGATASLDELRLRLLRSLPAEGVEASQVIDELAADVAGGLLGSSGGRFFAWVIGGSTPAAMAADWLTSAWDQNAGLYAASPAEGVIEEACGAWLKDLLGLPQAASFALVTGSQMAHVTCLAAARHAVLARAGWDVERKGLWGAPPVRILSGNEHHGTVDRALCLLGMGTDSVVNLAVDSDGRLRGDTLAQSLRAGAGQPSVVCLQAGDLNIGSFDPFAELIPVAHEAGAWVHVDGAFGLWAATSPRLRHMLEGVESADSWVTDGHKWLNVPYDSGYAFVAHPDAHHASMSHRASYLIYAQEARDEMDWNPEWSRRGRGVATYAALRELGRQGVTDLVERTCEHAHALTTRIGALPGAELIWEPTLNQGLVRFPDPAPRATGADHDRHTDEVIAAIVGTGEAFFGGTNWRGMRCMRVSVCSWQTTHADVDRVVAAAARVLGEARAPGAGTAR